MDTIISNLAESWLLVLIGLLVGLFIGWLLFRGKVQAGDLSVEGEGELRADADGLRTRISELEGHVSKRDSELEGLRSNLSGDDEGGDDETYALEWRNRYLAARVKYLEGRISETPKKKAVKKRVVKVVKKTVKKTVKKKAPAKKAVAKKVVAKKTVAKKPAIKKAAAKKSAAKKPGPKKKTAKAKVNPNEKYLNWVRKYDAKANPALVDNIVKYCGASLKSRDASFVSCVDEKELNRVAKGFCTKKLGMKTGQKELVANVCEQMKDTRMKSRVTFYYLCAKSARKMGVFR